MAEAAKQETEFGEWMNVYMAPELKQWVRVRAATQGQSISAWIRDLIERERSRDPQP